ncbi:MFS transporter [Shimia ponticola]|uniref:MFS transporter n=1 Tax=Shimia ponticola TaxID=2582893 RepID=UPI0011BFCCDF|nr:MFS transporter [Shimia ponticola]
MALSSKASQDHPAAPFSSRPALCAPERRRLILIAAILASALGFIDSTVVTIALPSMRDSLSASLPQAQWFHNAYMLFLAALILAGGALGDRFGLARIFTLGISVFVLASIVCAASVTPPMMIVARALQGIGAALMVPGSLAIISRAYPKEDRGRAIGIWAGASALTTALGPIIGGLALTFGGEEAWRAIFAINLPLGAFAVWLLWRAVEADPTKAQTRVDLPGIVLATASLGLLAYGLTRLQEGHDGTLPLFTGAATFLAFLWVEARSNQPMMPLSLFAIPAFSAANAATFLLYAALSILFFFLPMTLITAWDVTPIEASAAFAPLSVFMSLLSGRVGRLADRIGPGPLIATGAAIVAGSYAAVAFVTPAQNYWGGVFPAMCFAGLGMAFVVAPLSTAVMTSIDDAQSGVASGVNNAVSRMAGLVGVAAAGAIITGFYLGAGGTLSFGADYADPLHISAMTRAFQQICYVAAGIAACASATGLLIKRAT